MESTQYACGASPIALVRPVAPYIGGKRNLSRRLTALITEIPHELYAEVFVGMGGVFLRRPQRAKIEVINDFSRDVSNFYRVLQVHYVAFLELLRFQITSRAEFERLILVDPDTLTDMQRAARFLYLQRTAFGGKVDGRSFGVTRTCAGRFDVTRLGPMLEELHERLAGVVIERLPWADFLARYDRPGALFYLDPPYYGSEGDYGRDLFDREQFRLIAEALRRLKGRFLLSINDHPEVRRIFAGFECREVETSYTLAGGDRAKQVGELIITG